MQIWKNNLLNLNSSIVTTNLKTNLQYQNKIFDSTINSVHSLNINNSSLCRTSTNGESTKTEKRLKAFNRATNALGLIWNSIHQSNKLKGENNKKSTLSLISPQNILSSLKNNKILTGVDTNVQAKNFILYNYLNNCLYQTNNNLSLIKYKGRKNGNIINNNKIIGYNFSKAPILNNQIIARFASKNTYNLLNLFFKSMYCLISKPVIKYTNDKITIQLFYYLNIPKKKIFRLFSILYINSINKKFKQPLGFKPGSLNSNRRNKFNNLFIRWKVKKAINRFKNKDNKNLLFLLRKFDLTKVYFNKFKLICEILSNNFNKPVELQLTRLHHPYHDSNILVNLLDLNIKNKKKNANWAIKNIYSKKAIKDLNDPALSPIKNIPAFLSGLNIKIAGRLMREPIIPRITTKVFEKGAIATGKVNYLDVASITNKNKKGAYTIKIKSGQNFF